MPKAIRKVSIIPVANLPLIEEGDDLVDIIIRCLNDSKEVLQNNDVLVLSQKIVSKSEGNTVDLNKVTPSSEALALAEEVGKDPKMLHIILKESKRIVRKRYGVLITEHKKGWICANAGVDFSNVQGDYVSLLPKNPKRTAEIILKRLQEHLKIKIAVLICDSQGRPFREGVVGVALGYAGMSGLVSKKGEEDLYRYKLRNTEIALADQIASAALLVMGESNEGVPVAIVRGLDLPPRNRRRKDLIRPEKNDLFR